MLKPSLAEDPAFPAVGSHSSKGFILGLVIGALALGCVLWLVGRSSSSPARSTLSSPEGDLEVSYMVQESPSMASGSTLGGVTSIEFHPAYILVKTKDGSGRTFFSERTTKFEWRDTTASGRSSH